MTDLRLLPQCIGLVRNRTVYGLPADYLMSLINPVLDYCYDVESPLPVRFIKVKKGAIIDRRSQRFYTVALRAILIQFESAEPSVYDMQWLARLVTVIAHSGRRSRAKGEETLSRDALLTAIWMLKCYGRMGLARYLMDSAVRLSVQEKAKGIEGAKALVLNEWVDAVPRQVMALGLLAEKCATLDDLRALTHLTKVEPVPFAMGARVNIGKLVRLIEECPDLPPSSGIEFPEAGDGKMQRRVKVYKRADGTIRY